MRRTKTRYAVAAANDNVPTGADSGTRPARAPIRAYTPPGVGADGTSPPIGETLAGLIRRDGKADGTGQGRICSDPAQPPHRAAPRILTNLPAKIPVLTGEIALLETYWVAMLDLMAANDNEPD